MLAMEKCSGLMNGDMYENARVTAAITATTLNEILKTGCLFLFLVFFIFLRPCRCWPAALPQALSCGISCKVCSVFSRYR